MGDGDTILRVAVPSPLRRLFDYLPPLDAAPTSLQPGVRLQVPFGRGRRIGLIVALAAESAVESARLRRAEAILDREPVLPPDLLALAEWAAGYYHHPPGEVMEAVLPVALRRGKAGSWHRPGRWRLTQAGRLVEPTVARLGPRQRALLNRLRPCLDGLGAADLASEGDTWRPVMRTLVARGWVECAEDPDPVPAPAQTRRPSPTLNPAQAAAVEAVAQDLHRFRPFLLEGVTGSGKTEVYLRLIEAVVGLDRQALVLVPEIGLTPQLLARFREAIGVPVIALHSGLSERERLAGWLAARAGRVPVIIGTRSAVFVPLARPGLFIVDEEHDLSFKQQDGFRYSARDLCVVRAQRSGVPIVLGTATPCLESLHNAAQGRYRRILLPERAGAAVHPTVELVDVRSTAMVDGLAPAALRAIEDVLGAGGQVLVFINRRGYAPSLTCHRCGWVAECHRCDAHMVVHRADRRLRCHHCGAERPLDALCPACGGDLRARGQGTERVEATLEARFPHVGLARIDRDSTRRRGALEAKLEAARSGTARILVGTQMLAKGHHFPEVVLVVVLNADAGLYSADFRAGERLAQLLVQVAGRAGRAERPGRVLIQTHHPHHPLLRSLVDRGYPAFCELALAERRQAAFPPFASLALLRAEASRRELPETFLSDARGAAEGLGIRGVELLGPVPAPMERRAGRYRSQLMAMAERRADLQGFLERWLPCVESLRVAAKVRWSVDVDPQEIL
jgi:primosomal protein N' (replication factor Y)